MFRFNNKPQSLIWPKPDSIIKRENWKEYTFNGVTVSAEYFSSKYTQRGLWRPQANRSNRFRRWIWSLAFHACSPTNIYYNFSSVQRSLRFHSSLLSLFSSHNSNHAFTCLQQIFPIPFSLRFPVWFLQGLMRTLPRSSPKPSQCGEAHWNTNSGFASLQVSQLYHPAPDLSLAIQTKILVFSLSHSSKTVCTVTRQDLCWLRQCCASLTLGQSFLSLPLGTGKHAESQMFDQGPIWAKTEVVQLGTRERWSTQLRVVLWKQCWLHQCKARMELQCDAPIRSKF